MKLQRVLSVLMGIALLVTAFGCFTTPAEIAPRPNIEAPVEARLTQERAVDATVAGKLREEMASQFTKDPQLTHVPLPTHTPEPTSTFVPIAPSNPTSSPSSTLLPISVSPELLECVQTALGDDQYNAIISGQEDVIPQLLGIVMPCLKQYPQETKAIMDMFGLDMGAVMESGSHTPSATAQPKP